MLLAELVQRFLRLFLGVLLLGFGGSSSRISFIARRQPLRVAGLGRVLDPRPRSALARS
jgi:hypothetical protein